MDQHGSDESTIAPSDVEHDQIFPDLISAPPKPRFSVEAPPKQTILQISFPQHDDEAQADNQVSLFEPRFMFSAPAVCKVEPLDIDDQPILLRTHPFTQEHGLTTTNPDIESFATLPISPTTTAKIARAISKTRPHGADGRFVKSDSDPDREQKPKRKNRPPKKNQTKNLRVKRPKATDPALKGDENETGSKSKPKPKRKRGIPGPSRAEPNKQKKAHLTISSTKQKPITTRTIQKKQTKNPRKSKAKTSLNQVNKNSKLKHFVSPWEPPLPPVSALIAENAGHLGMKCHSGTLEKALTSSNNLEVLPSFKELCQPLDSLPFECLEASARKQRRKNPPAAPSILSRPQARKKQPLLPVGNSSENSRVPGVPDTVAALQAENVRFANEILVLRNELVLAYHSHEVPESRTELNKTVEVKQAQSEGSLILLPGVHTAITLVHLATQIAGCGMAYIPRGVSGQWGPVETSNPFLHCAEEGFKFIRMEMRRSTDLKAVRVVSSVFEDVHLKLTDDLISEKNHNAESSVSSVLNKLIDFLLLQIEHVFEDLLASKGKVHIGWSRAFCKVIVQPLCAKLYALSEKYGKHLEQLVINILKKVAEMLRDGEREKLGVSIRGLCHALEVSMAIALTLPTPAKQLPIEDIYTIGRHNSLFSDHLFIGSSPERRTK